MSGDRTRGGSSQEPGIRMDSFSLNFTLPANTTPSPVAPSAKANDCGPSIGLAAGIPSLLATALLVALLFTLIQRRRSVDEPFEVITASSGVTVVLESNPRRSPTHEMDPRGAQEGHIYVKTVSGSEEPLPDAYRRPEEIERRRGLWWLVPRLSLE
ncbi:hypothetical protein ACRRTK_011808 [Alexandromys fortis]